MRRGRVRLWTTVPRKTTETSLIAVRALGFTATTHVQGKAGNAPKSRSPRVVNLAPGWTRVMLLEDTLRNHGVDALGAVHGLRDIEVHPHAGEHVRILAR